MIRYNTNKAVFQTARTLAFGGISGTFAAVGTAFNTTIRIISFGNFTNEPIAFSVDGTNIHWVVPAGDYGVINLGANMAVPANTFELEEGTLVYAKSYASNPSSGSVVVCALNSQQ